MASALSINSFNTVINGQGLAPSANLLAQISTFQSHRPIQLIANIFTNVTNSGNAAANLFSTVTSIQQNINGWMIDYYPGNITPTCSGNVYTYATLITPIYDPNPAHWTTDPDSGATTEPIIGYNYYPIANTASYSHILGTQAQLPFANGMTGFANVFQVAQGFMVSNFDLVSSVHLLTGKTYAQSGIGYTGPLDLATDGISTHGNLISGVVKNWGTMYDINNINSVADVYVFGQNLLNQGFGSLGNLADSIVNAGLNPSNLSAVPQPYTTTTVTPATNSYTSYVGQIDLPSVNVQTVTTTVSGSSREVLHSIFSNITGANLTSIVSATGFVAPTGANLYSLNDYLDFSRVVDAPTRAQLSSIGIADFNTFSQYVQNKVGKAYFRSWATMAEFLASLEVPALPHLTAATTAGTKLLSDSTVTAMNNITGNGEGPFTNPILSDYLGAVAGMPHTDSVTTLNRYYPTLVPAGLTSALSSLDSAVSTYINYYNSYDANTQPAPDLGPVTSAVNSVNSILSSVPDSADLELCRQAYIRSITHLNAEVVNLHKAGVVFNAGYPDGLKGFAQQLPTTASDKTQDQTYQFFANLITDNLAGDTIRAAIAEQINTQLFSAQGIIIHNDPNPAGMIYQAQQQNIPLTTYISQNQ